MILFLLILMYEPLCAAFGVISQDKMEIRVRKASDETKRINILQALLRFFFKSIWMAVVYYSFYKQKETYYPRYC